MFLSAKKAAISQEVSQAQETCSICAFAAIAMLHFIAFCRLHLLIQRTSYTVSLATHFASSLLELASFTVSRILQAFLQLGPPGPLQLVFIRSGQPLFKLDLIGVPLALPIYVSTACRDNEQSWEQMYMCR